MRTFVFLSILAIAACGDDEGSGPTNPGLLTDAQTRILVPAVVRPGLSWIGNFRTGSASSGAVAVAVSINNVLGCPDGGSVTVSGAVTGSIPESGSGQVQVNLEEELVGCAVEVGGRLVSLSTTAPIPLLLTGTLAIVFHEPATFQTLSLAGTVVVDPELGSSQTCELDLTLMISTGIGTDRAKGTICDQAVDLIFQQEESR